MCRPTTEFYYYVSRDNTLHMGSMNTEIFAELKVSFQRSSKLAAINTETHTLLKKFNVWNIN
jgi:hypothetical protein